MLVMMRPGSASKRRLPRLEDFDDDAAVMERVRSGSVRDGWLFPVLLLVVALLGAAEWAVIVKGVGPADALECARTECSAYQDTIRSLAFLVVPALIVLALLATVAAGIRYFRYLADAEADRVGGRPPPGFDPSAAGRRSRRRPS